MAAEVVVVYVVPEDISVAEIYVHEYYEFEWQIDRNDKIKEVLDRKGQIVEVYEDAGRFCLRAEVLLTIWEKQ